jgi:hypothetical protein
MKTKKKKSKHDHEMNKKEKEMIYKNEKNSEKSKSEELKNENSCEIKPSNNKITINLDPNKYVRDNCERAKFFFFFLNFMFKQNSFKTF